MRNAYALLPVVLGTVFVTAGVPRAAAADTSGELTEVVVTAQKHSETVLDVPFSITAIASDTIERAGITQFLDYAVKVPNLSFGYSTGQGVTQSRSITIRGIQGANTTGLYIDDLPVPAGLDPHALDLARIEVLRGPQGTLYGARSMGGTVRLITQVPALDQTSVVAHGLVSGMDGGGSGYQADLGANLPLGEHLAARVSAFSLSRPGWQSRRFPDPAAPGSFKTVDDVAKQDMYGASASLLWNPVEALTIRPIVVYQRSRMNGLPLADIRASNTVQNRLFDIAEEALDEWTYSGLSATLHLPLGEVVSATSYLHRRVFENEEASDWTAGALGYSPVLPAAIQTWPPEREFVQELRFASTFGGPLQLTTGLFYSNSRHGFSQTFVVPGVDAALGGALGSDLLYVTDNPFYSRDKAVFGELAYSFVKDWTATLGLRYSENSQHFTRVSDGLFNGGFSDDARRASQTAVTPKFGINYQPSENRNYYALASKGFRPGGPNGPIPEAFCGQELTDLGLTLAGISSFDSDSLWNYEVGAKMRMMDRRVNINAALFYIDWKAIQQTNRLQCGFNFTGNAGSARSRGGEIEISAVPAKGLSLSLGLGYTDAKITGTAPTVAAQVGDPVQQVAPLTGSFAADYEFPLAAGFAGIARVDYSYVDHSFSAANDQQNPRLRKAYELLNLRAGVTKDAWELFAFIDNATNERPNLSDNQSQAAELAGRPRILTSPPRTFGLEARMRF